MSSLTPPPFQKSTPLGWVKRIGVIVPAALYLTTDNRVILYTTDEAGNPQAEVFNAPINTVAVKGTQQILTFIVDETKYQLDFVYFTREIALGNMTYVLVQQQHEIQNSDLSGWVKSLSDNGVQVKYFGLKKIILVSVVLAIVIITVTVFVTLAPSVARLC